jgi:hypothetical protein
MLAILNIINGSTVVEFGSECVKTGIKYVPERMKCLGSGVLQAVHYNS